MGINQDPGSGAGGRLMGKAWARLVVLVAGLIVPQMILFGPSLVGSKVLLPLDLLALPKFYLPSTPERQGVVPGNHTLTDQITLFEFERRFATREVRAGRWPLWIPDIYAGAPFVVWDKYSPSSLIYYCFPYLVTLAWLQVLKSMLAGLGAYLAFRRLLQVGYWPAAIGAWCYPLTGFFMLWQGYPHTWVTAWFPWVLLATASAVRRPIGWGGPALAVLTCLVIITRVDTAGHVLLASALFAAWCLFEEHGKQAFSRRGLQVLAAPVAGWVLGLLLSTPYLLPLLETSRSGARMMDRSKGFEERPPVGLQALPLTVVPDIYGTTERGSYFASALIPLESAAAAYIGLLATLWLAPLAFCNAGQRSLNLFWVVLACVGLCWTLNVPGLVQILRLPGLNMMSHNRFVFVTSFAILALAVTGLEVLAQGTPARRWWFALPVLVLVVLAVWCLERAVYLPEPIATDIGKVVRDPNIKQNPNFPDMAAVERLQESFRRVALAGVARAGLGIIAWTLVWLGVRPRPSLAMALGWLLVGELLWQGYGFNPQCDPALYYPPLPAPSQLAKAPSGRVIAYSCLPANLTMAFGLRDLRGYDSIDPAGVVELLEIGRDPNDPASRATYAYARVQWYRPAFFRNRDGTVKLAPVLSMMNVRHVILLGRPKPPFQAKYLDEQRSKNNLIANLTVLLASQPFGAVAGSSYFLTVPDDYWAWENPDVVPRVFVPKKVQVLPNQLQTLADMASPDFNPREIAYVDRTVSLPANCRGSAEIVDELPRQLTIRADMQTPGLLVLSDQWDQGWQAYRNGQPVPILRTNHAIRGVELPAGQSEVVFQYEPPSVYLGLRLMMVAMGALLAWLVLPRWMAGIVTVPVDLETTYSTSCLDCRL